MNEYEVIIPCDYPFYRYTIMAESEEEAVQKALYTTEAGEYFPSEGMYDGQKAYATLDED
jgi:hypothetical protein